MYTTMGQGKNDFDLQYSHIFIYSIRWLLLPTFRSLKNPLFSMFHIEKLKLLNLTFRKIDQDQPSVSIYTNFVELESWYFRFRGRKFLKGFYHIWARWPSWSCDMDHLYKRWYKILSPFPRRLHIQFGSDLPSGF